MDSDEFRVVLRTAGTDLWGLIDTAISVAARDHGDELRERRDGIVERLYTAMPAVAKGRILQPKERGGVVVEEKEKENGGARFLSTPDAEEEEKEEEYDEENGDDEKSKVLAIKELLEDPDQEEEVLVNLLQNLADMDITFKALEETDIGRHVNGLRKHPSSEVRRLVKVVVRKWKDLVDEWVKLNQNEAAPSAIITDGDSPQQIPARSSQNGNHVPEFGYSPNPHAGSSGSERSGWEPELKTKVSVSSAAPPRREPTPTKQHLQAPSSAPPRTREQQKEGLMDAERLASARRRLHENYQEAQNAKKQRTIQVMDIHDIPRPKNAYFPRNNKQQMNKHR